MNRKCWIALPVLLMTCATAMATDGVVTWNLTVEPTTISTSSANRTVTWYASVAVTGNNQGLYNFQFGLGVKNAGGNYIDVTLGRGSWQNVYAVTGPSGKPSTGAFITARGDNGGPGMSTLPYTGANDAKGYLSQCASSYAFSWDPWGPNPDNPSDPTDWIGTHTWGVGLASRKSALLLNPTGVYGILKGTIDTTTLAVGTYTVQLDAVSAGILEAGVNLSEPQSSGFWTTVPPANLQGATTTFTVGGSSGNQAPTAAFTANPTSGAAPLTVSFDASGSTDPDGDTLSFSWTFGDGQTATGATTSHTYTAAGTFTVTLTASDGKGGSNTKTATITVGAASNTPPTAVLAANPTTGNAPLTVSFDASGSTDPNGDSLAYAWAFGDNQTGTGATVSHTYTSAGSYTATLTVTDGKGGSDTKTVTITVTALPVAVVTATPTNGVAPLTVVFDGSGSTDPNGRPLTFSWAFGDGQTGSGAVTSHEYAVAGTYTATLTVNNGQGGSAQATATITVQANGAPTAVATTNPNPATGAAPLRVIFDASGSSDPNGDPLVYTWAFDDNTTAVGRTVSHTYAEVGPHIVTLTVSDGRGAADTTQIQVTVTGSPPSGNNPPTVVATATPSSGNAPLAVSFDGSQTTDPDGDALVTYVWDFGNGLANVGAKRQYTYMSPGQYTATLTVTDARGAVGVKSLEVFVNGPPVAAATATPSSGLAPLTTVLDATGSTDPNGDTLSYEWDFGDGQSDTGRTLSHTYASGGTYTATVTVTDGNGGTSTRSVSVSVNTRPAADGVATPTSGNVPLTVNFKNTGTTDADGDAVTSAWDFGDGATATGATVSHQYTQRGTYTARLTVQDSRSATSTKTFTIAVNGLPTPFAFVSPMIGTAPLKVSCSAAGSSDPEGDALSYAWDFGNGQTATGATATHTFTNEGTYAVQLLVIDAKGGQAQVTKSVKVLAPTPPPDDGDTGGNTPLPFGLCGAGVVNSALMGAVVLFAARAGRRRGLP